MWSLNYWLEKGLPKSKLIVGLPTYGLGFKLSDPKDHYIGASAEGGNAPGKYTGESGILSLYEVCECARALVGSGVYGVKYLYSFLRYLCRLSLFVDISDDRRRLLPNNLYRPTCS